MEFPMSAPTQEEINQFIIDCHMNLDVVKEKAAQQPELVHGFNAETNESALGAAGHMGRPDIAQFLLDNGAELELAAAAMMGMRDHVAAALETDPSLAKSGGAHGIPVAFHAAMSGDTQIMQLLWDHGAEEQVKGSLLGAVVKNDLEMVRWLLAHGADTTIKDFKGDTAKENAEARGYSEILDLLAKAE
jgi:ankyrin repeat protein